MRQRFTIVPPTGGKAQSADGKSESSPLDVILTLQRAKLNHEIGSRWLVVSFEEPSDNM